MAIFSENSLWFLPLAVVAVPAFAVDYMSVTEAQHALFPNADQFIEHPISLSDAEKKQIKKISGVRQRQDKQPIWRVQQAGEFKGWLFVDDVIGKHEYITYAVAVSPAGEVLGMEILSYRETHGGEVREAQWREHFVGKTLGDEFKLDKDVPNISGATLSCRNLLDGVKRLLTIHSLLLAGAA